MTLEKQRIAIAAAFVQKGLTFGVVAGNEEEQWLWPSGKSTGPPDSDLNAMHEAEKGLTYDQTEAYQNGLANLVRGQPFKGYCHWSDVGSIFVAHATARQRAEAFLKTLGLWTED